MQRLMTPTNNLSIGTQTAFCTRIRKTLGDKVNFAFSSAYSIDPELDKKDEVPTKPAVISYDTGELDEETPPPSRMVPPRFELQRSHRIQLQRHGSHAHKTGDVGRELQAISTYFF